MVLHCFGDISHFFQQFVRVLDIAVTELGFRNFAKGNCQREFQVHRLRTKFSRDSAQTMSLADVVERGHTMTFL